MSPRSKQAREPIRSLTSAASKNALQFSLLCLSTALIVLCAVPIAGGFAYNLSRVALLEYLQELNAGSEAPIPPNIYGWLERSASWGNRRADEELGYLGQIIDSRWSEADPLLFWLGIYGWQEKRLGRSFTDVAWDFARNEYVRIEAEAMPIGGLSTPNPFVTTGVKENSGHVTLYWQHNYLYTRLVVPVTGMYRITARVIDWPPVPLRLRVDVGNQSQILLWEAGDYAWRDQVLIVSLDRGMTTLRLTYLTPPGNRTQNASVDYLELERVN